MADSHSSRYGRLGQPERMEKAYGTEDANHAILYSYALYRKTADRFTRRPFWTAGMDQALPEALYDEACRLLKGCEWITDGQDSIERILDEKSRVQEDGTGLYLSALLNKTGMTYMRIYKRTAPLDFLGYRLAEGKTIAIRPLINAHSCGAYGRGTVLNWGRMLEMGREAEAGFQVNLGGVHNEMSEGAKGGLHVNFNEAQGMAYCAEDGVHVNFGYTQLFAACSIGGLRITDTECESPRDCKGGIQIDLKRGIYRYKCRSRLGDEMPSDLVYDIGLEVERLRSLKPRILSRFSDEDIGRLRKFDFVSAMEKLSGLRKETEDAFENTGGYGL